MFESLDAEQQNQTMEDPVTVSEALGMYLLVLILFAISLFAFIALADQPYGTQCATLIVYSGAIFIWTFFRTRGVHTRHRLSAPYVREQLPRLLLIHCVFMVAVFALETWALSMQPFMSSWWLSSQSRRDMPPFTFAMMLGGMAIGTSQIVYTRRILGKAREEFLARSTSEVAGT